jgi:exonuclease VII small subunit
MVWAITGPMPTRRKGRGDMQNLNNPAALRRSSRVPTALPILVTTLDGTQFSEVCKTLVVNAHGCAIVSPVKFETGVPLRFHTKQGREATAHVVSCQPIGSDNQTWRLGAKLERPENFWELSNCPEDWALQAAPRSSTPQPVSPHAVNLVTSNVPGQVSQSPEVILDLVARRLEAPLRRMVSESISPLQAQVTELKEALARRAANPSRFEVSLSSIPAELQEQLETRLRKDIAPTVLEDSRQQYAHLLDTAKTAIDKTTNASYDEFLRRAGEELKAVEKRAQAISVHITAEAQEHFRGALEEFHQKVFEGGNSLKRLSEELLAFVQTNVNDEHNARRGDLEQLRALLASESSRLHKQIEDMDNRILRLNESTRSLESGLDKRLNEMCSITVKDARSGLESIASEILKELTGRGLKIAGDQMDEANVNMALVQKNTVESASQLINAEAKNALREFQQSMQMTTKDSLEQWHHKLAEGLRALASSLGQKFESAADLGENRSQH